jgi:phosphinothricin acetyltransferase
MKDCIIRSVKPKDARILLNIYSYYVENTAISFEYVTPSIKEFKKRIKTITKRFPYICLVKDGQIKGYAYANTFHARKAYDWSVELSIYIEKDSRKSGYGRILYTELEKQLKEGGFRNLYAGIATPLQEDEYLDFSSHKFHEKMGFEKVAEFHGCGIKFDRVYNLIYVEKVLS